MRDVKNDNNATAIYKHAGKLGHSIDWGNYEILKFETDYHKSKFIESFYLNSLSDVFNDKNLFVFNMQYIPKFVFVILSLQFF